MTLKIIKWKCEDCGKEIKALYETELKYNKDKHILFCQGVK